MDKLEAYISIIEEQRGYPITFVERELFKYMLSVDTPVHVCFPPRVGKRLTERMMKEYENHI